MVGELLQAPCCEEHRVGGEIIVDIHQAPPSLIHRDTVDVRGGHFKGSYLGLTALPLSQSVRRGPTGDIYVTSTMQPKEPAVPRAHLKQPFFTAETGTDQVVVDEMNGLVLRKKGGLRLSRKTKGKQILGCDTLRGRLQGPAIKRSDGLLKAETISESLVDECYEALLEPMGQLLSSYQKTLFDEVYGVVGAPYIDRHHGLPSTPNRCYAPVLTFSGD